MNNILFILIFFLVLYYLYFLLRILNGIKKIKKDDVEIQRDPFASVIIPFRNESENILKNLSGLEAQDYPKEKFEVIYVNDSSDDDSLKKINGVQKSSNIKILSVPESFSVNAHKKRAIRFGIENSQGDIIVTTDADCYYEKDWLKKMISEFDENTGLVSGPVIFLNGERLFDKIQKIEFAGLVLAGAGLIGAGTPTICNAANLSYRRSIYNKVNGFNDQMNLSSGDDELLLQKIRRDTDFKIKFCWNNSAVVKTQANKSYRQFYHQRKRWASKGLFYADKFLILKLILIFLFYLSIPVQIILLFTHTVEFLFLLLTTLVVKLYFEFKIVSRGKDLLQLNDVMKYFLLVELLHIPYILITGISGLFGNYIWKKRKIKR